MASFSYNIQLITQYPDASVILKPNTYILLLYSIVCLVLVFSHLT